MNNPNNIYKTFFYILVTLLLVGASFVAGVYYQKNQPVEPNKNETSKEVVETEKKISISPNPSITSAIAVTTAQVSAATAIKQAMAKLHNKNASEVNITIAKQEPGFVSGGVTFAGEMGGGWFLAAEVGGEWVIAADGNGTVSCEKIEPYNFPVSLAPECWDETTQELINR